MCLSTAHSRCAGSRGASEAGDSLPRGDGCANRVGVAEECRGGGHAHHDTPVGIRAAPAGSDVGELARQSVAGPIDPRDRLLVDGEEVGARVGRHRVERVGQAVLTERVARIGAGVGEGVALVAGVGEGTPLAHARVGAGASTGGEEGSREHGRRDDLHRRRGTHGSPPLSRTWDQWAEQRLKIL